MVNRTHKLTVDDLIVEYMMCKMQNGYEPYFYEDEFIDFLKFFENKIEFYDAIYDKEKLFKNFFSKKYKGEWKKIIPTNFFNPIKMQMRVILNTISTPISHQTYMYSKYDDEKKDYLIKAGYMLSKNDKQFLNTYFMEGKDVTNIRNIISEYLLNQPKRIVDENEKVESNKIMIGKYYAFKIITKMWDYYLIKQKVKLSLNQDKDIYKYLIDEDLSKEISSEKTRKDLLELYKVFSKRISVMYNHDEYLRIDSYDMGDLAFANYKLLINGYEKLMNYVADFCEYENSFDIDLSLPVQASIDSITEKSPSKTDYENIKKLVKKIDNCIDNK